MQALSDFPENISQAYAFFNWENGCAQSKLRCHNSLIRWATVSINNVNCFSLVVWHYYYDSNGILLFSI